MRVGLVRSYRTRILIRFFFLFSFNLSNMFLCRAMLINCPSNDIIHLTRSDQDWYRVLVEFLSNSVKLSAVDLQIKNESPLIYPEYTLDALFYIKIFDILNAIHIFTFNRYDIINFWSLVITQIQIQILRKPRIFLIK